MKLKKTIKRDLFNKKYNGIRFLKNYKRELKQDKKANISWGTRYISMNLIGLL